MIALLEAKRAGLLEPRQWMPNIVAGAIAGMVALPLAMAFAIACGARPEQGVYTAVISGILVSILGGSTVQIAGPTGVFVVILSGVTAKYGVDGLQIVTLMGGAILLLLGLARMGAIIKFIPDPVIVGFTAGIAVIMWVGQWQEFFGLPAVPGEHFHQKLFYVVQALPALHLPTTTLAVISLTVVIYGPRIAELRSIPGPLLALVVATLLQALFRFDGVATLGSTFGGIQQTLPSFRMPEISMSRMLELVWPAFTIAMLGSIESLLSAAIADGMAGTRHDSDQELVAQGVANLAVPLFGGFAVTGSIALTATNVRNGASSPVSGIMHAVTLILATLFLSPLAAYVPLAAFAAILFVVAWSMCKAKHFVYIARHAAGADVAILIMTFTLTVFADVVVAINIGVVLGMLQVLRKMSASVKARRATRQELEHEFVHRGFIQLPPGVLVYSVAGPFFFGTVASLERALAFTHSDPHVLIIRLRWVPFLDITAVRTLEEVIVDLRRRGVRVMLTGTNQRVYRKLLRAGVVDLVGSANIFEDLSNALHACRELAAHDSQMAHARSLLMSDTAKLDMPPDSR